MAISKTKYEATESEIRELFLFTNLMRRSF